MRKVFLWVHLTAGLIAAAFLILIGGSGAIIAFENELDRALNPKVSYVNVQAQPLTLDALDQKLLARYPGAKIAGYELPQRADLSLFVALADASGKEHDLFVDPYSGAVLGDVREANQLISRVHQFHTHLLAGDVGKTIVGWSGVFLLVLSITGIVLWTRATIFRVRPGSAVRFNFELHNTVGILSSVFLLIFAWTGICIHWERPVGQLAQQLSPKQSVAPTPRPALSGVEGPAPAPPVPGSTPLSPDRLLEIAHSTLPDAKIMFLQMPQRPGQPASVALKFPEDHTPLGRTRMSIDAYSGNVLRLQSSREMSAPMKYAMMWNREVHTGDILNLPTRVVAAFFSLMLPVLAVTGPLIWWNRKRAVSRAASASPAKASVVSGLKA